MSVLLCGVGHSGVRLRPLWIPFWPGQGGPMEVSILQVNGFAGRTGWCYGFGQQIEVHRFRLGRIDGNWRREHLIAIRWLGMDDRLRNHVCVDRRCLRLPGLDDRIPSVAQCICRPCLFNCIYGRRSVGIGLRAGNDCLHLFSVGIQKETKALGWIAPKHESYSTIVLRDGNTY